MLHHEWIKDNFVKGSNYESFFNCIRFRHSSKFEQLKELLNNQFISDLVREDILNIFSKIQKCLYAISKLKRIIRLKRTLLYNTDDLYMNPISPMGKNVIVISQNNTRYVFHIRELMHAINCSLSNCCHFFPSSIICKNPYTNIPFSKSALYNIYFAVRSSTYLMPILFHKYFLCNFDYYTFCMENNGLINEEYLKTYLENSCLSNVFETVVEMFEMHNMKCNIHKTFPKEELYGIMKPYLKLYFISNFSINRQKKRHSFHILHKKLHYFINYNSNFGRRKVRLIPVRPFSKYNKCTHYFDNKYPHFVDEYERDMNVSSFMTSHLEECVDTIDEADIEIINEDTDDNETVIENSDHDDLDDDARQRIINIIDEDIDDDYESDDIDEEDDY